MRPSRRTTDLLLAAASIVAALVLAETADRVATARANGLPLLFTSEELLYPSLAGLEGYRREDTNVLLLGGSALQYAYPTIVDLNRNDSLALYNFAETAHTSLDSLNKLRYLTSRGYRFDYVFFYEAINETRANNIPAELYRDDYGHFAYYRLTNAVFGDRGLLGTVLRRSALAFRAYRLFVEVSSRGAVVPADLPERWDWMAEGASIKTRGAFRRNLEQMIAIAKANQATLLVSPYAYNVSANVPLSSFPGGTVQCGPDSPCPVEIWGLLDNVVRGIAAHNEVIEALRSGFTPVDAHLLGGDRGNFVDICHFSARGREAFARLVLGAIPGSGVD